MRSLEVSGYRSIRSLTLPLQPLTVVQGANASGKTSLYRSLELLQVAVHGGLARRVAAEGGMPSLLWAGEKRDPGPVRLRVEVELTDFGYSLACGHPRPRTGSDGRRPSAFTLDPELKEEELFVRSGGRKVRLAYREGSSAQVRNETGRLERFAFELDRSASLLSQVREPHRFPELSMAAQTFAGWRFYHSFRTDAGSPLRAPQIGIRTPVLAADGQDLAAALQTIYEIGDGGGLDRAIQRAFPGARLTISEHFGRFEVELRMPGMKRAFGAAELSDGSLRYLCLAAALLSPRPPSLLAFNEPESSLHPRLLGPLAELCAAAAQRSQLWITTHSQPLAQHLEDLTGYPRTRLELVDGRTHIVRD